MEVRVSGCGRQVVGLLPAVRALVFTGTAVLLGFGGVVSASAQAPAAKTGIEDTWQGTLHAPGKDLRTVLKISKNDKGALAAQMFSIDQGGQPISASSISFQDGTLKYAIEQMDLTYSGKLSADGKSITGESKQGDQALPLIFERATQASAWAIPEPPAKVPPMAADANPSFEVSTIKPSKPDEPGKLFGWRGGRFKTINTTLVDLIKFSYDVLDKQVLEAPAWASTEKYDIDAQPDTPGQPSVNQLKLMVKKLLTDRFGLKFHEDKRELSAYVLTVSKSGPKLKKNDSDPNGLGGLFFRGLGVLTVTNSDMDAFCALMQSAVLDRPVVNHTELAGKWDFLLKWTPDESQFGGMGVKIPPPGEAAADAPPPLFTAMPDQLGLKLDAERAQVKVLVLDHAEKPSDN